MPIYIYIYISHASALGAISRMALARAVHCTAPCWAKSNEGKYEINIAVMVR